MTHREPRPWQFTFMDMAYAIAQRSKDDSTQVGAVLVSASNEVLATGFNGPPPQFDDEKIPWDKRPEKYAYVLHAEENCLLHALDAYGKEKVRGSYLYCTHIPCPDCILRLIRSNVHRVMVPSTIGRDFTELGRYGVSTNSLLDMANKPYMIQDIMPGYMKPVFDPIKPCPTLTVALSHKKDTF